MITRSSFCPENQINNSSGANCETSEEVLEQMQEICNFKINLRFKLRLATENSGSFTTLHRKHFTNGIRLLIAKKIGIASNTILQKNLKSVSIFENDCVEPH